MPIDLPSSSRFKTSEVIRKDGKESFGLWKKYAFLEEDIPDEEIIKYEVNSVTNGRPDLIANEVYSNPELYWVVIAFNKPLNTLNWPSTGMVIQLPPSSRVLRDL